MIKNIRVVFILRCTFCSEEEALALSATTIHIFLLVSGGEKGRVFLFRFRGNGLYVVSGFISLDDSPRLSFLQIDFQSCVIGLRNTGEGHKKSQRTNIKNDKLGTARKIELPFSKRMAWRKMNSLMF
jgi:hypothetical protein